MTTVAAGPDDDGTPPGDGAAEPRRLHLASWEDRFWAWLIDVLLVGAVLSSLGQLGGLFDVLTGTALSTPLVGLNGFGFWIYWTALEGNRGQSAGKMVMDVAVTDERGEPIDYPTAAIESFGKAFVLPLDVLVGWLAMEGEYVRLFNKLSSTIVVGVPGDGDAPAGVEYVRPDE